ncbi:hypothetical protein COB55_03140 [Candidatus Wolfebacteria bacterium]|nr:MAG: hypothetical protein COB55_03140 [Candidatus Wolfebacteria bacterium]
MFKLALLKKYKVEVFESEVGMARVRIIFNNGYVASLISGQRVFSDSISPYEIAIMDKNEKLVYDTPITDDVLGYLTENQVLDYLEEISNLPERD